MALQCDECGRPITYAEAQLAEAHCRDNSYWRCMACAENLAYQMDAEPADWDQPPHGGESRV